MAAVEKQSFKMAAGTETKDSELMPPERLFVHGLAKSGTSFLRNLLHAHPDIILTMERMNVLWKEYRMSGMEHDTQTFEKIYQGFIERQIKSCPGRRYIGDKICFGQSPYIDMWETLYLNSSKIIAICRDPRDRLISLRYHFCNRDKSGKADRWFYPQPYFDPAELRWWNDWMPKIRKRNALIVYYEDLFNSTFKTTRQILDYLEIEASDEMVQTMVDHARNTKRIPYELNPFRKGIPGEWKKKLLPEDCLLIKEAIGPVLFEHGWETNEDWEYTSLETLKDHYYFKLKRFFLKSRFMSSRDLWQWLKENREKSFWIKSWIQSTQRYDDPLMNKRYYSFRQWLMPEWFQRSAALCIDRIRSCFGRVIE